MLAQQRRAGDLWVVPAREAQRHRQGGIVAEQRVLEALYQCLTCGEPSDEDLARAQELFRKLCTLDVTKALLYGR